MRMRHRVLAIAVAALTVIGLAGCGSDDSTDSGDGLRVAAIGFGDVDTLLKLGVQPVAVAPWSKDATEVVGEWSKPLLTSDPILIQGSGSELSTEAIEKIASSRPDVIVAVNTGYDDATYKKLEAIARVVRRPAGFEAWGVPWQDQVKAIAAGVDKTSEGTALISATQASLAKVTQDRPELAKSTGVVVLPKADGSLYAYSSSDGRGQTMKMLGIPPLPRVTELAGADFYTLISAENLSMLGDVDLMVYLDYGVDVSNSAAFDALPVARDNRVVKVDKNLGQAMSMPNPVTLEWVAANLVPMLPA